VKQEEKREAGLGAQKVQGNDFVVGADPENTSIITIAQRSVRKIVLTATYVRKTCVF
jgi:hypothetical protein